MSEHAVREEVRMEWSPLLGRVGVIWCREEGQEKLRGTDIKEVEKKLLKK